MAGRANGRGSKSSSTSKGVRERIKDAREMKLSGIKSRKKDTATSGTRGKGVSPRPRRAGPKGGTQITESVDNLIGGAFTKNGSKRGDLPKTRAELREKRKELIQKRREQVTDGERTRSRRSGRDLTPQQEAARERLKERLENKKNLGAKRGRRSEEEGDGTGRRIRPSRGGIRGRGGERLQELREKYGGKGAGTKSSPGPKRVRPNEGRVKPKDIDPKRGGGDNQPNGTGQKGRIGPKRGGSNRNPIGQAGGNVGPGGKGAIPIYEKGNGPKRGGGGPKRGNPGPKRGARPGMAMEIVTPEMFFM